MGKRADPLKGIGLETLDAKLGMPLSTALNKSSGEKQCCESLLPNIYMLGGGMEAAGGRQHEATEENATDDFDDPARGAFSARQLLKRMFQGELCSVSSERDRRVQLAVGHWAMARGIETDGNFFQFARAGRSRRSVPHSAAPTHGIQLLWAQRSGCGTETWEGAAERVPGRAGAIAGRVQGKDGVPTAGTGQTGEGRSGWESKLIRGQGCAMRFVLLK